MTWKNRKRARRRTCARAKQPRRGIDAPRRPDSRRSANLPHSRIRFPKRKPVPPLGAQSRIGFAFSVTVPQAAASAARGSQPQFPEKSGNQSGKLPAKQGTLPHPRPGAHVRARNDPARPPRAAARPAAPTPSRFPSREKGISTAWKEFPENPET